MTYHDQLLALGDEADSKIASITTQAKTTTHADEGGALGLQWDQAVAAAKPPAPPKPTLVYGISGGDNVAASASLVGAHRLRVYNQGGLNAGLAAGVREFWHSEKIDQARLAARDSATMNQVKTLFSNVPAGRATMNHERDNDTPFSTAAGSANQKDAQQYQAAYQVFIEIIASINASRDAAHKLLVTPVTTGQLYKSGNPAWWYVADADEIGFDCYVANTFAVAFSWMATHAAGKPIALGEIGYDARGGTTGTPPADDVLLARMQSDQKIYSANPLVRAACWFNNGNQELTNRPKSAAQWKTYCAQG